MLLFEIRRRRPVAALGQVVRLVLGILGSAVGKVPVGNTGGSDISMFKRMPIAPELQDIIEGRAPTGARRSHRPGIDRGQRVSDITATSLFLGVLFGSIGLGFFIYGRKQRKVVPLLCGLVLMIVPYFIPDNLAAVPGRCRPGRHPLLHQDLSHEPHSASA